MTSDSVGTLETDAPASTSDGVGTTDVSRIVVTGFEPFDGRTRNRSWDLVRRLELPEGRIRHRLPVDFIRVREMVLGILADRPNALLMVGEAPTSEVLVEQVALNVADADGPDNAGRMPQNETLVDGGPLALALPWDARGLAGLMHQEGIPAVVSFHAGTFACNAALYFALHAVAEEAARNGDSPSELPAIGFLHVPNSRGTAGLRSTNLARAVELAISELLEPTTPAGPSSSAPPDD